MNRLKYIIILFVVFLLLPKSVFAEVSNVYSINETAVNFRTGPGTTYTKVLDGFVFTTGDIVNYIGVAYDTGGALWYNVSYNNGGTLYTGYVFGTYVTITTYNITTDQEFEAYLIQQGFPSSYFPKLKELHALYPSWVFQALKTNVDFETAVTNESYIGKSLIHSSRDVSYRSTEPGSYNWDTDTWTLKDSSSWYAANRTVVAYYLDPRNFLNLSNVFMFESLSYQSAIHTKAVVQGILNNTFMSGSYDYQGTQKSYADTFIDAANFTHVSPVHLAARARQEQGTGGTSRAISGAWTSCWSNAYEVQFTGSGIYNYFNVGAFSGADPVCNGFVFASGSNTGATTYQRPWSTRYASILGGAEYIGNGYINKGQNTLYLQKFNVNPLSYYPMYTHQYMTNVEAAKSESSTTYNSYLGFSALNNPFVFMIPVYNNMPTSTSLPTVLGNPNNYLNSLKINGTSVPSFSKDTLTYTINVPASVNSVNIDATKISSLSSISGTGNIELTSNNNKIDVVVTAGNGTKKTYTINITKDAATPVTNSELLISLNLVNNNNVVSGLKLNSTVNSLVSEVSKLNYLATTTIKDVNNNVKASGNIATGDTITITNNNETINLTAVIYGDVNGDGVISIKDLLSVQKAILKATTLSGVYEKAGDPNKDGLVSIKDLLAVQKHILGASLIQQ